MSQLQSRAVPSCSVLMSSVQRLPEESCSWLAGPGGWNSSEVSHCRAGPSKAFLAALGRCLGLDDASSKGQRKKTKDGPGIRHWFNVRLENWQGSERGHVGSCTTVPVWKPNDNVQGLVLSFHHVRYGLEFRLSGLAASTESALIYRTISLDFTLIVRQGLSLDLEEFMTRLDWLASKLQGSSYCCLPSSVITGMHPQPGILYRCGPCVCSTSTLPTEASPSSQLVLFLFLNIGQCK